MNESQQKFIRTQAKTLEKYIIENILPEKNPTKRNDKWSAAAGFIEVVSGICKDHESEARHLLWDITDKYEGQNNG